MRAFLLAACAVFFGACSPVPSSQPASDTAKPAAASSPAVAPSSPAAAPPAPPLTGSDRDAHGCIGSAGYSWCAKQGECVHPWEVAKAQNLDWDQDTEANGRKFDAYCGNPLKS